MKRNVNDSFRPLVVGLFGVNGASLDHDGTGSLQQLSDSKAAVKALASNFKTAFRYRYSKIEVF